MTGIVYVWKGMECKKNNKKTFLLLNLEYWVKRRQFGVECVFNLTRGAVYVRSLSTQSYTSITPATLLLIGFVLFDSSFFGSLNPRQAYQAVR